MSDKRSWGKSVLGWFVVQEDGSEGGAPAEPLDADALIKKYAESPAAPSPIELKGPLPAVVNGVVDFAEVFRAAGVTDQEHDRVQKARELLASLPAETPVPVKRQIVEAALKAFGVPTDQIIEAAVQEIEGLEAFIRAGQSETQKVLAEGAERIAALEQEIASIRGVMKGAVADQESRTTSANNEKLRVQQVLEFFGQQAVHQVVQQSPKLHSPES